MMLGLCSWPVTICTIVLVIGWRAAPHRNATTSTSGLSHRPRHLIMNPTVIREISIPLHIASTAVKRARAAPYHTLTTVGFVLVCLNLVRLQCPPGSQLLSQVLNLRIIRLISPFVYLLVSQLWSQPASQLLNLINETCSQRLQWKWVSTCALCEQAQTLRRAASITVSNYVQWASFFFVLAGGILILMWY